MSLKHSNPAVSSGRDIAPGVLARERITDVRSYRDYIQPRPGFPLPFADRQAQYAIDQERRRLEKTVSASRNVA